VSGTPITAIRRPPYKGGSGGNDEFSSFGPLGTAEEIVTAPSRAIAGLLEEAPSAAKSAASSVGGDVVDALGKVLGEKAVPILLNIALVGGGAFLVYFGIARMVGVGHPVRTPAKLAAGAAV
jgi:hypothetical protein